MGPRWGLPQTLPYMVVTEANRDLEGSSPSKLHGACTYAISGPAMTIRIFSSI